MRLSPENIGSLPGECSFPGYDRDSKRVGIVHFGLGAFARAHLADYTNRAMENAERDWMIAGVSLRSAAVAKQLNPQGGLFTVTEQDHRGDQTRVVGSVREVLSGQADRAHVIDAIASPDCHIVSFTITEKGYCRTSAGELDLEQARSGFYPLLAQAMARRRSAGLPGLTLLSCDNLPENGKLLGQLVRQWLKGEAPELLGWFSAECRTPNTMVDRIVPATTGQDLVQIENRLGVADHGAVVTETFTQWVIEDNFAGLRPRWERYGAQLVADVAPYETAKLRMLNGAHSLLAYSGLQRGYEYVHQAINDPRLRQQVISLMLEEAAPTIRPAAGQDLQAYANALVRRFENPALGHRLEQIAMDGSQKIPQRWLAVLAQSNRPCPAILSGLAAWLHHIADGSKLNDPLSAQLREIVLHKTEIGPALDALFGDHGLITSDWTPSGSEKKSIEALFERA